jgi:hypothetical protein
MNSGSMEKITEPVGSYERDSLPTTLLTAMDMQKRGEAPPEPERLSLFEDPTKPSFTELREIVLKELRTWPEHAYHNVPHSEDVEARFQILAEHANIISNGNGERKKMTEVQKQLGRLRALFHDVGHSGTSMRRDAIPAPKRADLSNEEFAALRVHTFLSPIFSPEDITYIQTGVLGTTYGQEELGYGPRSDSEKLLALADVADFMGGLETMINNSFKVMEELPATQFPATFEQFVNGRQTFLAYCRTRLMSVQQILDDEFYKKLAHDLDGLQIEVLEYSAMSQKYEARYNELKKRKGIA